MSATAFWLNNQGMKIMSDTFDINMARTVHLKWELDLEAMVAGRIEPTTLESHENCHLGRWLHFVGVKKYQDIEAIHQLIDVHRNFHKVADKIVFDLKHSKWGSVEKNLKQVQSISMDIIFMLTVIEFSSLEKQRGFHSLPNPIRKLMRQLFEKENVSKQNGHQVLEVSHARLTHVRWSRDLLEAFRNRGRDVQLSPAETCPLGVWIRTVGLHKFGELPPMQKLDEAHKSFHLKADQSLNALKRKNDRQADQAYEAMLRYSQEVIYLLTMIEYRLQNNDAIAPPVSISG
ncbi:MAG: CZB domain-containing protein [Magnetococcales bacterium]|nr:CZB domain-containing protein [Magnetococcales bacterium]